MNWRPLSASMRPMMRPTQRAQTRRGSAPAVNTTRACLIDASQKKKVKPPPRLPLLPEVINQSRSISPLLSPGGPDPLSSAQMNMGGSGQRRGACGSANEHADRSLEMSRRARNGASSVANTLNRHTLCDWDRQAHLLLPESESPEVSFELSAGATCSY